MGKPKFDAAGLDDDDKDYFPADESVGNLPEKRRKNGRVELSPSVESLFKAIQKGNLADVQAYTQKEGFDPNVKYFHGDTPLIVAARSCHLAIVNEILTWKGVNKRAQNEWGDNALIAVTVVAAGEGKSANSKYEDVIDQLLKDPEINIHARNTSNETAASIAYRYRRPKLASRIDPSTYGSCNDAGSAPCRKGQRPSTHSL